MASSQLPIYISTKLSFTKPRIYVVSLFWNWVCKFISNDSTLFFLEKIIFPKTWHHCFKYSSYASSFSIYCISLFFFVSYKPRLWISGTPCHCNCIRQFTFQIYHFWVCHGTRVSCLTLLAQLLYIILEIWWQNVCVSCKHFWSHCLFSYCALHDAVNQWYRC